MKKLKLFCIFAPSNALTDMKKLFSICLMVTLLTIAKAQQVTLNIEGSVPTEIQTLTLTDMVSQQAVDTIIVINGHFQCQRSTEKNQFFSIGTRGLTFLLISDGTPININFNKGALKGSSLNERLHRYDLHVSALDMAMQYAYMAQDRQKLDSLRTAWQKTMKQAVVENADNIIPAYYINEAAYFCDYDEMKQLLSPDKPYYNHPLARQARTMLQDYELKMPGKPFVDMEMSDSFGRMRRLSEWCGKGHYVLLHFWNSNFAPCRKDMEHIAYCYEMFHDKGLEVIGVSFDTNKQQWLRSINELKMVWPQLSDLKGEMSIATEAWGIHSFPANVLIGPDGIIVASNLYNGALEDKVEELLK